MKGNCNKVICQLCDKEMSFGRIKRHISSKHNDYTLDQYLIKYYLTLPLHNPCIICNKKIVYKYQTCSKECHSILISNKLKGILKPEGFMGIEHKYNLSKAHKGKTIPKEVGEKISKSSKGVSRNKGRQTMLGKSQSEFQKSQVSKSMLKYYSEGNEPWTKNNKHTPETISKIISHRPMNNLEKLVSEVLVENNIEFQYQFFLNIKGLIKSFDFKLKNKNILLEIDGDYYHGGPGCKKHFFKLEETQQNDLFKTKLAEDNGYKVIRVWESEIKNNPNIIIDKLDECI